MNAPASAAVRRTADRMAVFLARQIRDGETVFHGVASLLPMVAIALARRTHAPQLTYLNIPGGVNSSPVHLPASTVGDPLLQGARSIFNLSQIFDLSARGGLDLAFLGGAQIDARGDINLSFIGDPARPKVRLPGGAGSAAILPTAGRTVLWRTQHDPRSFPERCDYVTASGRVDRVITPLCVFRSLEGRLQIESRHAGVSADEVRAATGFDPGPCEAAPETPEPTDEEREALQAADPGGVRFREFS
ncbi:MAG: CoA-transferase [bacterium]|nr:CoA-transferase [bacterium]